MSEKTTKRNQEDEYELAYCQRDEKSIIRVYRPILTEEERERRMEKIKRSSANLMKSVLIKQAKENIK